MVQGVLVVVDVVVIGRSRNDSDSDIDRGCRSCGDGGISEMLRKIAKLASVQLDRGLNYRCKPKSG